jgi:SAM-dependent methyltransferase
MDTSDWTRIWNESQSGSFLEKRRRTVKEWSGFWDGESDKFLENVKKDEAYYRRIIRHLTYEGFFRPDDDVLDIACGPGTYALLFAEGAKSVSALDISQGMLSTLMAEAKIRSLGNVTSICSPWLNYVPERKYDLMFTALSPAIDRPEMLLKMEKASKRSCCYVTFGDERFTKLRNELWDLVIGQKREGDRFNVSIPFGLLMSMGRRPGIKFFDKKPVRDTKSVDEIISRQAEFFKTFTDIDEEKKALIRSHVQREADNGTLDFGSPGSLVALYWDVPEKG